MAREQKRNPVEVAVENLAGSQDRMAGVQERTNDLLATIARRLEPEPTPRQRPGEREPIRHDGETFAVLAPLLTIAFKRAVPKRAIQSMQPGIAIVECPCGAVVQLGEREQTSCPGPEGGECPRSYLYTGRSVRVANAELLEEEWKDREGPPAADLAARAFAEKLEGVVD